MDIMVSKGVDTRTIIRRRTRVVVEGMGIRGSSMGEGEGMVVIEEDVVDMMVRVMGMEVGGGISVVCQVLRAECIVKQDL